MTSQILLLTQPRGGSTLLERMLGTQSKVKLLEPLFSSSRGYQVEWLRDSYPDKMAESLRSAFNDEIKNGIKGQVLMVNTHPFFPVSPDRIPEYIEVVTARQSGPPGGENPTMIPDGLLLQSGTVPIFNIRDPRLVVPSAYRTMHAMDLAHGGGRANYLITTCHIWSRLLYDFYVSHGVKPIVVDADDFMTSEDFVRHLCSQAGLDPAQAYFSWSIPTKEEQKEIHPYYYASQSTLINSSGINPAKAARNLDLDAEEKKWETEFGDDLALVKEMVELAMPHYQYLFERRLEM